MCKGLTTFDDGDYKEFKDPETERLTASLGSSDENSQQSVNPMTISNQQHGTMTQE